MSIVLEVGPNDAGKRLDWFLHEHLPSYSRSRLQSWIKDDHVLINDAPAKASQTLKGGERIRVSPAAMPPLRAMPEAIPLQILYEDADVVVVDKPAGLVVHAGAGRHDGTLVNALLHHFGALSTLGGDLRPGIVHRLDKDTSGLLVVARTDAAHQSLAAQFQSREVEKVYLALVHGHTPSHGTIRKPISRDPVRRTRMTTRVAGGRPALTDYEALEEIGDLTLLRVRIGTGRTHQIRVHLASLNHPIVGDTLYGAPKSSPHLPPLARFFLHAHKLRFRSPSHGGTIELESPLAPELGNWLNHARSALANTKEA